jgi:hypothetical protein
METFFKLLDDLIRPGNWPFLAVFALVLIGMAVLLVFQILAYVKKERLDLSHRFGPLWIHLRGGPDDPKTQPRRFRKLLYVKVNFLANQKTHAAPFYKRTVERLDEPERIVPVFDEAVYYTLKLFPEKRTLGPEQDSSSGVVDPRLVIPWLNEVEFHNEGAQRVKSLVDVEAKADSDTMLSVSHFLNGLQRRNQDFCTYADEDAESLRLVVDFSSIPNAHDLITMDGAQLLLEKRPVETDDVVCRRCSESVYMAHCKDVKKGSLLKMEFTFKNWEAAADEGEISG